VDASLRASRWCLFDAVCRLDLFSSFVGDVPGTNRGDALEIPCTPARSIGARRWRCHPHRPRVV
jgi:hypothetical protein